jgi:hypothetical protein
MDELLSFVRRCLDDDERVIRQLLADPGGVYLDPETPDTNTMNLGAYLMRWPPKRMLAEVDAKRRLLNAHSWPHECIAFTGGGEHSVVDGQPWELWEPESTDDHGPCFVVRTLAQPYAGRDGWREEWHAAPPA